MADVCFTLSNEADPDGLVDIVGVIPGADLAPRSCVEWLVFIIKRLIDHDMGAEAEAAGVLGLACGISTRAQLIDGSVWVSLGVNNVEGVSRVMGFVVPRLVTDPEVAEAVRFLAVLGDAGVG
jgi:hypothetical protein